jgi:hypothetical protein
MVPEPVGIRLPTPCARRPNAFAMDLIQMGFKAGSFMRSLYSIWIPVRGLVTALSKDMIIGSFAVKDVIESAGLVGGLVIGLSCHCVGSILVCCCDLWQGYWSFFWHPWR